MERERLLRLAEFLEKSVPVSQFNMGIFGGGCDKYTSLGDCGTSACACGWATVLFEQDGFKLDAESLQDGDFLITYRDRFEWDAIEEFFGLDAEEAESLFMDASYNVKRPTPAQVAAHIREFIQAAEVPP